MLPTMTLLNNVMLPMELAKRYTPAERRARATEACFNLFHSWVDQGKTFLMVTHSRSLAARTRRTLELADGRLIHDEPH